MERDLKKSPWIDEEHSIFLVVPLGNTMVNTKAFIFLLLLSPLSLSSFSFSLSPTAPKGCHTINPWVSSTKEAWGGSNLPPPQVNRLDPFSFLLFYLAPGAQTLTYRATGRPNFLGPKVGQHGPLWNPKFIIHILFH